MTVYQHRTFSRKLLLYEEEEGQRYIEYQGPLPVLEKYMAIQFEPIKWHGE